MLKGQAAASTILYQHA